MKFRMHVLAGLLAAAAVPALANAEPYIGLGERQQRAEIGHDTGTPAETARARGEEEHVAATPAARHVDLGELQRLAELGRGTNTGEGASPEFYALHQKAMDEGVSHIAASEQAARMLKAAHD